jgi:hypothetical protein
MQAVLPGKIRSWKPNLPEGAGNGFSVGDMQHQEKATIARIANIAELPNIAKIVNPYRLISAIYGNILAVLAIPSIG